MVDFIQVMDNLSIGTIVMDQSLEVVFWNRWMSEHSTIARKDAVGKSISELFPVLKKKGLIKKTRAVFKTGKPVFFTHKVHHSMFPFFSGRSYLAKDLTEMQQTVILSPLQDEDGKTNQVLLMIFDITDWVVYQDQLLRSKEELEKLSQIDDLTNIPNRRNIMDRLNEELLLHHRKKRPMSLAVIDIDNFKQVNDTYGHQCGDFVLCELADILAKRLRSYDAVGRYGGEEFMLILPESIRKEALLTCERLCETVAEHIFKYHELELQLTISIGVAFKLEDEIITADDLFKAADCCLYMAKEKGRNQVVPQDGIPNPTAPANLP